MIVTHLPSQIVFDVASLFRDVRHKRRLILCRMLRLRMGRVPICARVRVIPPFGCGGLHTGSRAFGLGLNQVARAG